MRCFTAFLFIFSITLFISGCQSSSPYDNIIFPQVPDYSPSPMAKEGSVVRQGNARFTILTPTLIHLEWSDIGVFEDRATQTVINRNLPTPEYSSSTKGEWLEIETQALKLKYKEDSSGFTEETLQILVKQTDQIWNPNAPSTPIKEGSIFSKQGWTFLDESQTPLFAEQKKGPSPWLEERLNQSQPDWYLFAYGEDLNTAFIDAQQIFGKPTFPPRSTFGTWLSLQGSYSDSSIRNLVHNLDQEGVSVDVLTLDKMWHGENWSGYTWNSDSFADPTSFLTWCNNQGFKVGTNLHPSEGVPPTHESFRSLAKKMKLKRKEIDRVPFSPEDSRFQELYFTSVVRPVEDPSVQFWWIDWQQKTPIEMKGIDSQLWLSYLFWKDWTTNPARVPLRPLILNSKSTLGSHRYTSSVETLNQQSWSELKAETEKISLLTTLTPPTKGLFHSKQPFDSIDPELRNRWIQLSLFSHFLSFPVEFHSDEATFLKSFDEKYLTTFKESLEIRSQFLPYIYTMTRQSYDTGTPLVKPLFFQWPEITESYRHPEQFLFGDDFLVRPVTTPVLPETGWAQVDVWFPPGSWTNWFTGESYTGPTLKTIHVPEDQIPLYVKSGSVIPTRLKFLRSAKDTQDHFVLKIFPGMASNGKTTLYEDDGVTEAYHNNSPEFAKTTFHWNLSTNYMQVKIDQSQGQYDGMENQRLYEIQLHDVWPPEYVQLNSTSIQESSTIGQTGWVYDSNTFCLTVRIPLVANKESALIVVGFHSKLSNREAFHDGARGRVRFLKQLHEELGELSPDTLVYALRRCTQVSYNPERGPESLNYAYHEEWETFKKEILEDDRILEEQKKRIINQINLRKTLLIDPTKSKRQRKPLI